MDGADATRGFGAYGKMPAVGDFFRLHPPPGFVTPWDAWVQSMLLTASEALGEAFDEAFMSAPIWRFTLAAGLAGPAPALGVLMPSVDRVGRRFPLTLVVALEAEADPAASHFRAGATFAALEDLALDMLEDGVGKPDLEARLADLAPPGTPAGPRLHQFGTTMSVTLGPGSEASGLAGALASGLLAGRVAQPSMWSTEVEGVPRLMVTEGLPGAREMVALISLDAAPWVKGMAL